MDQDFLELLEEEKKTRAEADLSIRRRFNSLYNTLNTRVDDLTSQQNNVSISGNESITGIKTFTQSPFVPNIELSDTNNSKAINKKYCDDKIAELVNSSQETLNSLNELSQALGNDQNFAANIASKIASEGTVNFNNAGADVISVGIAGTKIKQLNFSAAKTVGAVYANNISILANGTATFTDVIDANQIKFTTVATSIANFGARNLTTLLVSDGGSGKGIANFVGTGIQSDVGAAGVRLAQANFALGQDSAINANVYANAINVNGTITMNRAATFDGATTFNAATINLNPNDLTLTGGVVNFNGNSIIQTRLNKWPF